MKKFVGLTAPIYERLISDTSNILIAGCPGSGKSTLLNSLLEAISLRSINDNKTVLIDVKQVEFAKYEDTEHCLACATNLEDVERTLKEVLNLVQKRLTYMKGKGLTLYDGAKIHLVIDEMADLMLTSKEATNLIQRISQLGRATKVQVILATQCPLASVIPTRIKVNFPILIGLHTATAQHSRNIIEERGCERLPMHGEALIRFPGEELQRVELPMIPEDVIEKAIVADKKVNG